ncbi:MAG TPA: anti-sigma factor [Anaerolineae bacterium]
MTTHNHVLELLPAYALGSLDEDEAAFVADHLVACAVCRDELAAFESVVGEMALAVPEFEPNGDLKQRLLSRIQGNGSMAMPEPELSWRERLDLFFQYLKGIRLWQPALLLLVLLLVTSNLLLWRQVNWPAPNVNAGRMQAIPLSGTGLVPEASGYILVSADGRNGAVVVDGLPVLDDEHEYQLWLISDGERTSGAVFSVDETGYSGTRVTASDSLFTYTAAGITIEPAGGSPGPTGDRVLEGTLFTP